MNDKLSVKDAYRIHRTASRNVGRGRGYTARNLDKALPVLERFWKWAGGGVYVTEEMIEQYEREVNDNGEAHTT